MVYKPWHIYDHSLLWLGSIQSLDYWTGLDWTGNIETRSAILFFFIFLFFCIHVHCVCVCVHMYMCVCCVCVCVRVCVCVYVYTV